MSGPYAVELREWLRRNERTEAEAAVIFDVPRSLVARWVREGGVSDEALAIIRSDAPAAPEKKKKRHHAGFWIFHMRCALNHVQDAVKKRLGYEAGLVAFPYLEPVSTLLTQVHSTAPGSGFPANRPSEEEQRRRRDIAIGQVVAGDWFLYAFRHTDEIELWTLCEQIVQLSRHILQEHAEFLDERYETWAQKLVDDVKAWEDAYKARPAAEA